MRKLFQKLNEPRRSKISIGIVSTTKEFISKHSSRIGLIYQYKHTQQQKNRKIMTRDFNKWVIYGFVKAIITKQV